MDRVRRLMLITVGVATLMLVGPVAATAAPATWTFHDCSGGAGTPSGFTATHANSAGSAWSLTDGTTVFVVLIFEDLTAGKESRAPGHDVTGNATTTCSVVNPFTDHTLRLSGFLSPLGQTA
jgi:hypothetical protein